MGSTFSKVRKYNLNSTGEPTAYKYNTIPDEEIKPPLPPPLPINDKVTSTAPRRPTPRERAWRYDPKEKDPKESFEMFTTGYPPRIHPFYFGFHVTEDMQIPERYPHHYVKNKNEPREYKYPDYRHHSLATNIDDTTPLTGTTSSSFGTIKPDSASDPNPKPHQKYYSADDINKLLKPLKFQNTPNLKPPLSYYTLPYQESYNTPRYQTLGNPLMFDNPQYKCCHHKDDLSREFHVDTGKPPPYPEAHLKSTNQSPQDTSHQTYDSPSTQHYSVSNPYIPQHLTQNQYTPSNPYTKYHTIHNDKRIPLHQREEFSTNSTIGSPPPPRYFYQQNLHNEPQIHRQCRTNDSHGVHQETTNKEIYFNENEPHTKRYRRNVFFRNDPVSKQNESLDYPAYTTYPGRSSSHYCYTIPEEPAWLQHFSYSPASSTEYHNN